jgi:glycosyltransferase involved in cell wall biosynthesis
MRILISALSCNAALGSEALVGFKYAEALARRHEVVILASPPSQTPQGATLIACDAGPCSFNEIGAQSLLRFELRQWRLTHSLRLRFPFDCVHRVTPSAIGIPTWTANLGKPLVVGPLIAANRPPAVFTSYLNRPMSRPNQPRWHPARIAARLCRMAVSRAGRKQDYLRQAQIILVGTQTALHRVPEPLRAKCRLVTYSGIEHEVFVPPSARSDDGTLRLLFVGRLVPYKGLELLLRALKAAIRRCALKLDIIGNGDSVYKEFLMQLIRELGLDSVVTFLPARPRDQLPALYQQADVFCFPTLCDTYGIALLEAMSCGCAVLVSDVAAAGEIVNSENGLKVPLRTPEQYIAEYAGQIVALAQNRDFRRGLGEKARQFILREHDWDRIGRQVLAIYEELTP